MKFPEKLILLPILFTISLCACGQQTVQPLPVISYDTTQTETEITDWEEEEIQKRCGEIFEVLSGADSVDAAEMLLAEAGYDVLDSNGVYPEYLVTGDRFRTFWECVMHNEAARQEIIRVTDDREVSYMLFVYENGQSLYYTMRYGSNGAEYYEKLSILDWELTEKGNFYFRIYPADNKHYMDYFLIRLMPPDLELYDWNLKCILPVGYTAVNLFLCDWTEEKPGSLGINDLWEYFYYMDFGEMFNAVGKAYHGEGRYFEIPAAEFEAVVMSRFGFDRNTFRKLARYDAAGDFYPWRPLETNDFVYLWFYSVEPEVTAYRENADGTVTLTVEVRSNDLKCDCLFAHEVTIRPAGNGEFQYVGNLITYQTEYGLPHAEPRLLWDWQD